ncbi:MAG TPA: hypothetical protein VNC82_02610 [Candidatus Limnocylindria bacterium]|nr:hypothetical protein [Candidatus Limnocylindria bacterium]
MGASPGDARAGDARFMELALELAARAIGQGQTPFGAVLVDPAGQVIGRGHNTVRADLDPTAHAAPRAEPTCPATGPCSAWIAPGPRRG